MGHQANLLYSMRAGVQFLYASAVSPFLILLAFHMSAMAAYGGLVCFTPWKEAPDSWK